MFDFLDGMALATVLHISGAGIALGYMFLKLKREQIKAQQKRYDVIEIINKRMKKRKSRRSSGEEQ